MLRQLLALYLRTDSFGLIKKQLWSFHKRGKKNFIQLLCTTYKYFQNVT